MYHQKLVSCITIDIFIHSCLECNFEFTMIITCVVHHLLDTCTHAVLEMLTDLSVRKRWDKQFTVMEVLEEHDNHDIIYWYIYKHQHWL